MAFGKTAETCGNFLNKGKLIYLEGSLRTNPWEDKEGVKRYTTEIVMRDFQMLGSGPGDEQGRQAGQNNWQQGQGGQAPARREGTSSQPGRSRTDSLPPQSEPPEDDIPF